MWTSFRTWLILACLACATRVSAQDSPTELKELKPISKGLLKTYKQTLAQMSAELEAQIDTFVLHQGDLASDDGPLEDLVAALAAYQASAYHAELEVAYGMGNAAGHVIAALPEGGPDEDVAPVGLVCGDGGVMDQHVAASTKIAAKTCAALNKKLDKMSASLRKQTDMRLKIVVQPVQPQVIAPQDSSWYDSPPQGLDIDLVVSFNRGGTDDDGRVWVGGSGLAWLGPVAASAQGAGRDAFGSVMPSYDNTRWLYATDPQVDPLMEGNYVVTAKQADGAVATEVIGLR